MVADPRPSDPVKEAEENWRAPGTATAPAGAAPRVLTTSVDATTTSVASIGAARRRGRLVRRVAPGTAVPPRCSVLFATTPPLRSVESPVSLAGGHLWRCLLRKVLMVRSTLFQGELSLGRHAS